MKLSSFRAKIHDTNLVDILLKWQVWMIDLGTFQWFFFIHIVCLCIMSQLNDETMTDAQDELV